MSSRSRVCFFLGPSVSSDRFRTACAAIDGDVVVLPPIQQGDLLRLADDTPDVIGIIDGYFYQVPAVLHKEILFMLERGTRVLGASSLGALRAAELDVFGMEGVGEIYRMYRQGEVDGDDEVALLHTAAEDGYRPLTQPLVNLRHNLKRAQVEKIISAGTARRVLACGKRLPFNERNYNSILQQAAVSGIKAEELVALRTFLRHDAVDLKRDDALALVQIVAERIGGRSPWPILPPLHLNRSVFFFLHQRAYQGRVTAEAHLPDALVLALYQVLTPSFPRFCHRVALRCVAVDEALERGLPRADVAVLLARFDPQHGLHTHDERRMWLQQRGLSEHDLITVLDARDLEDRLLDLYRERYPQLAGRAASFCAIVHAVAERIGISEQELVRAPMMRPGIPWETLLLDELKLSGRFERARTTAQLVMRSNAELAMHVPGLIEALSVSRIENWCAQLWSVLPDTLDAALREHGFFSRRDLVDVARLAYVHVHYGSASHGGTAELLDGDQNKGIALRQ